jgi:hypothetical protein
MNERIKLPAQEWLGYDPEKGDIHGYTFEQMRDFAQLIIQECIASVDNMPLHCAYTTFQESIVNCAKLQAIDEIQKLFKE